MPRSARRSDRSQRSARRRPDDMGLDQRRQYRIRRTALAAMVAAALPLALPCTPAHAADEAMLEFTVIQRDTLIHLSRTVLVSPRAWREVARINKLPDPNLILPG